MRVTKNILKFGGTTKKLTMEHLKHSDDSLRKYRLKSIEPAACNGEQVEKESGEHAMQYVRFQKSSSTSWQ
jgi:hypothetical protein